jgi:hypothetical protein
MIKLFSVKVIFMLHTCCLIDRSNVHMGVEAVSATVASYSETSPCIRSLGTARDLHLLVTP